MVRTIQSAKGAAGYRNTVHLESFHANTVDALTPDVATGRTKGVVALYTDRRVKRIEALALRDGAQIGANDGFGRQMGR